MSRTSKIHVGDWFGMWQVANTAEVEQTGTNRKVLCRCGKCGYQRLVFVNNLLAGQSTRCNYCRGKRGPDQNSYGHLRSRDIKIGTRIGALTVLAVMQDTPEQRKRRTVKAQCLCGALIIRRVEVIRRDEFPTCHHCRENGTIYRWGDTDHDKIPTAEALTLYCESHECRWFDMTVDPLVEHSTPGFIARMKRNEKGV